jgi:glycosyltransferase involved in cell wall biosynthesis
LDEQAIVRLVLDKCEIGGAVLDVDVLDRALARRHSGLRIHKIYLSLEDRFEHHETVGSSSIHYHPIPYRKEMLDAELARLVDAIRRAFLGVVARQRPLFFADHVPEHPSGALLSRLARDFSLPVIAVFHGGNRPSRVLDADHARSIEMVERHLKTAFGLSDRVASVSASAADWLRMTHIVNLGTGADPAHYDSARAAPGWLRERFDLPRPLPVLLLSSRLVPEKGHGVLLEASQILFERDVDHRIVFAGSASSGNREWLENHLATNRLRSLVHVVYDATQAARAA